MYFHILGDVRRRNGDRVGELRHLVIDPHTREVVSLVVQPGAADATAVVIPIGAVESTDDDGEQIYVALSPEEIDSLEKYAYGFNTAPPPADMDPRTESADLDEEPFDVPDVAPVGAAQGITSIAFTPIVDVVRNVPPGDIVVDSETRVLASDADIGVLRGIATDDETNRVESLTVERGEFFHHDFSVPAEWMTSLHGQAITLGVSAAQVRIQAEA